MKCRIEIIKDSKTKSESQHHNSQQNQVFSQEEKKIKNIYLSIHQTTNTGTNPR